MWACSKPRGHSALGHPDEPNTQGPARYKRLPLGYGRQAQTSVPPVSPWRSVVFSPKVLDVLGGSVDRYHARSGRPV